MKLGRRSYVVIYTHGPNDLIVLRCLPLSLPNRPARNLIDVTAKLGSNHREESYWNIQYVLSPLTDQVDAWTQNHEEAMAKAN
jgi:hypothetical protein